MTSNDKLARGDRSAIHVVLNLSIKRYRTGIIYLFHNNTNFYDHEKRTQIAILVLIFEIVTSNTVSSAFSL